LVSHLRILYRRFWWLRFLTLLAGFAEADRRPFLDCRAQIPGVAGEEHRHAVMVLGAGRGVPEAEAFELGAVVGVEPARRLLGRRRRGGGALGGRGRARRPPRGRGRGGAPGAPAPPCSAV